MTQGWGWDEEEEWDWNEEEGLNWKKMKKKHFPSELM